MGMCSETRRKRQCENSISETPILPCICCSLTALKPHTNDNMETINSRVQCSRTCEQGLMHTGYSQLAQVVPASLAEPHLSVGLHLAVEGILHGLHPGQFFFQRFHALPAACLLLLHHTTTCLSVYKNGVSLPFD